LELNYDEALSNFAFNVNWRRYILEGLVALMIMDTNNLTAAGSRVDFLLVGRCMLNR
jgi:hypothetical protein